LLADTHKEPFRPSGKQNVTSMRSPAGRYSWTQCVGNLSMDVEFAVCPPGAEWESVPAPHRSRVTLGVNKKHKLSTTPTWEKIPEQLS